MKIAGSFSKPPEWMKLPLYVPFYYNGTTLIITIIENILSILWSSWLGNANIQDAFPSASSIASWMFLMQDLLVFLSLSFYLIWADFLWCTYTGKKMILRGNDQIKVMLLSTWYLIKSPIFLIALWLFGPINFYFNHSPFRSIIWLIWSLTNHKIYVQIFI